MAWYQAGPSAAIAQPLGAERFEFADNVRDQLHAMWRSSSSAKQEMVACMGGEVRNEAWHITTVRPLVAGRADSLGIVATTSIEECGAPEWLGTVHTHVALRDGVHPYATFSGADRGVMSLWWQRWKTFGVFCLLYSDREAHCEADGVLMGGAGTQAQY